MRTPTTRDMSDDHEKFLVDLFGGKKMPNSGAVWSKQMDVRNSTREIPFSFAVDGKSTLGLSVGVSRAMWKKAKEQSHAERTALALRFYKNGRLDVETDLVVLEAEDFRELLSAAREHHDCES